MNVRLTHLTMRYRRGRTALEGIDLELATGMFGLLGPNGAGKTTLMRILATLLAPTSGSVEIGPWRLERRRDRAAIRAALGYLPQDLELYPELTASEMIEYVALLEGVAGPADRRRRSTELLELVGLRDAAGERIKALSGGMRQRVGIAQALVNDPQLLIVDEPTAGLDPQERIRFRNLLTDLAAERTVLLSTHIVEDIAQSCHQLAVLDHGRIAFRGTVPELVRRARGHVWHTHAQPAPDATVVATLPTATGTTWRAVGTPPPDAELVEPTLEDGYVALMRRASPRAPLAASGLGREIVEVDRRDRRISARPQ